MSKTDDPDVLKQFVDIPEAQEELAGIISDGVFAFMKLHEEDDHGGLPCWDERMNFISFICHRVGIKSDQASFIVDRLREYELRHDENCPAGTHTHDGH